MFANYHTGYSLVFWVAIMDRELLQPQILQEILWVRETQFPQLLCLVVLVVMRDYRREMTKWPAIAIELSDPWNPTRLAQHTDYS